MSEYINLTIEGRCAKVGFTTARINAAIDTAQATATHIQLHTGAPGVNGTTSVAAGVARALLSKGAAASKIATDTASWTIPGAGGPFTHCTLWDALTGGTFCGDGLLTPNESFVGAGTLAVTVTITGT